MTTNNSKVIVALAAVIMLLSVSGCALARGTVSKVGLPIAVGELQNKSESVKLDSAKSQSVEIDMPLGKLDVSGGASELLQAEFSYNIAELEPRVSYNGGRLAIQAPDLMMVGVLLDDYRYDWDLHLNDNVPMKLRAQTGASSADLKLGSLSLTRLDLTTGAGPVSVDLTGNWQNDLDANISGGLGSLTLRLPRNACVRADVERGIGSVTAQGLMRDGNDYVNDACGKSSATLRIDISGGVGSVNLVVGG